MAANHNVADEIMRHVVDLLDTVEDDARVDTVIEVYHRVWGQVKREAVARQKRFMASVDPTAIADGAAHTAPELPKAE